MAGEVDWDWTVKGLMYSAWFSKKGFLQSHRPISPKQNLVWNGKSEELLSNCGKGTSIWPPPGVSSTSLRTTEEPIDKAAAKQLHSMSSKPAANPGSTTFFF